VSTRQQIKRWADFLAVVAVLPVLLSFRVRSRIFGRQPAFEHSVQALALVPGFCGQYVRRAFLRHTIHGGCSGAVIGFGTLLADPDAFIGDNVYIGPHCDFGLVHLERDVLIASGVHIPSGPVTHGIEDLDVPIREQPGARRMIRIGEGSWIGNDAVIMADVGKGAVIGAGSVVTRPVPPWAVAVGSPAKVIRMRQATH
jgi:virginiamycin A acetyltransferase